VDINGPLPSVACAVPGCAAEPITDVQVAKHASDDALARYIEVRQQYRDAKTQAKALELVEEFKTQHAQNLKATQTEAERTLLQSQLTNAFGNSALMCPRCGFGPVQHFHCTDLTAHNGEEVRGGGRIDNRCPNCRFFAPNVRDWVRWDGVLRDFGPRSGASVAAVRPVPSNTSPQPPRMPQQHATSAVPSHSATHDFIMAATGCSAATANRAVTLVAARFRDDTRRHSHTERNSVLVEAAVDLILTNRVSI